MTQHSEALVWARKNLGEHETPSHSNTGPFVIQCQRATWLGGTRWPWCVAFWQKAWATTGRTIPYKGAGAYSFLAWFKQHNPAWVVPLEKAKPGAAVIWNIGSGHMSMLERPYSETRPMVHTVDGNVSDMVARRVRSHQLVRGVVDPPEVAGTVPAARKPVYEVIGSASGKRKVVYVSGQRAVSRKLGDLLNKFGGLTIRRKHA